MAVDRGPNSMAAQPRAGGSRAFAIVLVTVCLPSLVAGATLVVDASLPAAPATYQNLTAAVAAASNGDTVLVRPGVYSGAANSGIAFTDAKTLIVQGEGGWGDVIIDCAGGNRAFSYIGSDASRVGASHADAHGLQRPCAPRWSSVLAL